MIRAVRTREPAPLPDDVPEDLQEVIGQLLKKDPAEREQVDVGVLDVVLQTGSSASIANLLRSTNRPFVFLTGFHNLDALPEDLRESPCLEKPVDREALLNAVAKVARKRGTD